MRRRTPDRVFCRLPKRISSLASHRTQHFAASNASYPGTSVAAIMQRYELL
jgi:hypothetical protein